VERGFRLDVWRGALGYLFALLWMWVAQPRRPATGVVAVGSRLEDEMTLMTPLGTALPVNGLLVSSVFRIPKANRLA